MIVLAAKTAELGGVEVFALNDNEEFAWIRMSDTEIARLLAAFLSTRMADGSDERE
jgi:hypothetical protein